MAAVIGEQGRAVGIGLKNSDRRNPGQRLESRFVGKQGGIDPPFRPVQTPNKIDNEQSDRRNRDRRD